MLLDDIAPYVTPYYILPSLLALAALPLLRKATRSSPTFAAQTSAAMPDHTVVVLGAGFVGVAMAHHLLKHTPADVASLKVVLVAPNDALYWNVAAPRGFLPADDDKVDSAKGTPGFGDDKLFYPLAPLFAKYNASGAARFEQLVGRATRLDPDAQTVDVAIIGGTSSTTTTVAYDTLLVATGSDIVGGVPFKILSSGGTAETKAALAAYRAAIGAAKHIVVAGGGMTGVELAGELGSAYGKTKAIQLIVSEAAPLAVYGVKDGVQQQALGQLKGLGVTVVAGTRVAGTEVQGQKTVLTLEGKTSDTLATDVYIPAFGITFNTQFVPAKLLDTSATGKGRVRTRKTLQAEGYDNIFVAGDAANLQAPSLKNADDQVQVLSAQLQTYLKALAAKEPAALSEFPAGQGLVVAVSIGPGGGTGQVGSWRLFSFLLWVLKARFLGTNYAGEIAAGTRTPGNSKW
ncbi:fad binding protein [Ophiostoma piceae UAMH 11346]|uniref:Fad binding protein n=1 Tax=Ophiostoma piceae (strain UAMH 11346) TaxID=1262450 RepID=S3BU49_OPHP1|nr:fad binding protein [Ophiostoma piceae UAMH 11346]